VPRTAAALLALLLFACGDSDRKSDAAVDVRAEVSVDVSASVCPALGIDCNPYLCRNGTCLSTCTSNAECVAPATCRSGSCLGPNPQSCTQPAQCASGFCSHGVCCERACTSPCETCARPDSIGKCRPLAASMLPDAGCGPVGGGQ
jgi:hypothetical protein